MAKKAKEEAKAKAPKPNPTYVCKECGSITEDQGLVCRCKH